MAAQTYCYNITGDMTIWPDVAYSRIWRLRDKYYGIKKSGIYEITGNTDNGAAFTSTFTTAPNLFGKNLKIKSIPSLYIDSTTTGNVSVSFEGDVSTVATQFQKAKRVKLARGVRGRFGSITVSSDVAGFQVNAIDVHVEERQRGVK